MTDRAETSHTELSRALERRAERRRLLFWRVLGVLGLGLAALVGLYAMNPAMFRSGDHVARISIEGVMLEGESIEQLLDEARENDAAKAAVIYINSPGGGTYAGESVYLAIRRLAEEKPTIAVIGPLGASAAYMAAVGADHVLALHNSLTGSIGVIFETADLSELMERIGVDTQSITSGPLKDTPSVTKPLSEQGRQYLQNLVNNTHVWFVRLVAERRDLDIDTVMALADGRVFLGDEALEAGLIDGLGSLREARTWLAETHSVPESLPLQDYRHDPYGEGFWGATEALMRSVTHLIEGSAAVRPGLWSKWVPDASQAR